MKDIIEIIDEKGYKIIRDMLIRVIILRVERAYRNVGYIVQYQTRLKNGELSSVKSYHAFGPLNTQTLRELNLTPGEHLIRSIYTQNGLGGDEWIWTHEALPEDLIIDPCGQYRTLGEVAEALGRGEFTT